VLLPFIEEENKKNQIRKPNFVSQKIDEQNVKEQSFKYFI